MDALQILTPFFLQTGDAIDLFKRSNMSEYDITKLELGIVGALISEQVAVFAASTLLPQQLLVSSQLAALQAKLVIPYMYTWWDGTC